MELTRRDFGEVFAGEVLEQIFFVRNAGTKPLELARKSMLGIRSAPAQRYVSMPVVWRSARAMPTAPS